MQRLELKLEMTFEDADLLSTKLLKGRIDFDLADVVDQEEEYVGLHNLTYTIKVADLNKPIYIPMDGLVPHQKARLYAVLQRALSGNSEAFVDYNTGLPELTICPTKQAKDVADQAKQSKKAPAKNNGQYVSYQTNGLSVPPAVAEVKSSVQDDSPYSQEIEAAYLKDQQKEYEKPHVYFDRGAIISAQSTHKIKNDKILRMLLAAMQQSNVPYKGDRHLHDSRYITYSPNKSVKDTIALRTDPNIPVSISLAGYTDEEREEFFTVMQTAYRNSPGSCKRSDDNMNFIFYPSAEATKFELTPDQVTINVARLNPEQRGNLCAALRNSGIVYSIQGNQIILACHLYPQDRPLTLALDHCDSETAGIVLSQLERRGTAFFTEHSSQSKDGKARASKAVIFCQTATAKQAYEQAIAHTKKSLKGVGSNVGQIRSRATMEFDRFYEECIRLRIPIIDADAIHIVAPLGTGGNVFLATLDIPPSHARTPSTGSSSAQSMQNSSTGSHSSSSTDSDDQSQLGKIDDNSSTRSTPWGMSSSPGTRAPAPVQDLGQNYVAWLAAAKSAALSVPVPTPAPTSSPPYTLYRYDPSAFRPISPSVAGSRRVSPARAASPVKSEQKAEQDLLFFPYQTSTVSHKLLAQQEKAFLLKSASPDPKTGEQVGVLILEHQVPAFLREGEKPVAVLDLITGQYVNPDTRTPYALNDLIAKAANNELVFKLVGKTARVILNYENNKFVWKVDETGSPIVLRAASNADLLKTDLIKDALFDFLYSRRCAATDLLRPSAATVSRYQGYVEKRDKITSQVTQSAINKVGEIKQAIATKRAEQQAAAAARPTSPSTASQPGPYYIPNYVTVGSSSPSSAQTTSPVSSSPSSRSVSPNAHQQAPVSRPTSPSTASRPVGEGRYFLNHANYVEVGSSSPSSAQEAASPVSSSPSSRSVSPNANQRATAAPVSRPTSPPAAPNSGGHKGQVSVTVSQFSVIGKGGEEKTVMTQDEVKASLQASFGWLYSSKPGVVINVTDSINVSRKENLPTTLREMLKTPYIAIQFNNCPDANYVEGKQLCTDLDIKYRTMRLGHQTRIPCIILSMKEAEKLAVLLGNERPQQKQSSSIYKKR